MADITDLILEDHRWFRAQFIALDDAGRDAGAGADESALNKVWEPLAQRLDLHAVAEEQVFYPQLLKFGKAPEDETLDAIGDHNDIRDGVHDAARHPVGTDEWWAAVRRARQANDQHMAEEEREGIADFRRHAPAAQRVSLGRQFAAFLDEHRTTDGVDTSDKDPQEYVREIERTLHSPENSDDAGDPSLGIASLKGKLSS